MNGVKCPVRPLQLPSGAALDFSVPRVMSIVNCTPDSFYGPSRVYSPEEAAERALTAEAAGADIVDFGAESTRPGADYVDAAEEMRRLIPALRLFRKRSALPVSVDTRKAKTARAALDEGADIINDISALADPDMIPLCAGRKAAVALMHMRGMPKSMESFEQGNATPPGVPGPVEEVRDFLAERAERAAAGGIPRENIILDPGIGFGKPAMENMLIIKRLAEISGGGYYLLVGLSRKRFIGEITGRAAEDRLAGTIAASAAALLAGADIIRVHDTAPAVDTVKIITALRQC